YGKAPRQMAVDGGYASKDNLKEAKAKGVKDMAFHKKKGLKQVCLRPRDRFWDIPVPKIDSAFDNLFVPQPSWSPSTTQQLRKLVAAPYLSPNDWTPRLDAYFASPLALCARRVSSAASRLLGSTSLRFALHGWQRSRRWPKVTGSIVSCATFGQALKRVFRT
uniref:hypothetical protein n=1 Tax=Thiolapillus sp. TaxID=2017437 RepID=UPI003AF5F99E